MTDDGKIFCNLGKGNRRNGVVKNIYELNPRLSKNGYARVYMRRDSDNKRIDKYIHRLVAEYFLPNPFNYKYVNHKNCIRHDNRLENLEWCTAKENTQQTEDLKHIIRNEKGQFVSNFNYEEV